MTLGVKEYFNVMLGTQLLYKFERPQYGNVSCSWRFNRSRNCSQPYFFFVKTGVGWSSRHSHVADLWTHAPPSIIWYWDNVQFTSLHSFIEFSFVFVSSSTVKLGGMLAYTPLDERSIQLLLTHVHDLLKYMTRHSSSLFSLADYIVAPPEYHRKALWEDIASLRDCRSAFIQAALVNPLGLGECWIMGRGCSPRDTD